MRIDYLLFGYRIVTVKECDKSRILTALIKAGLSAEIKSSFEIIIPEYQVKRFISVISGFEYTLSKRRGLFRGSEFYKISLGAVLGVLLSLVLLFISSDFVFDIRIECVLSHYH